MPKMNLLSLIESDALDLFFLICQNVGVYYYEVVPIKSSTERKDLLKQTFLKKINILFQQLIATKYNNVK
jgi:hypothetical protein